MHHLMRALFELQELITNHFSMQVGGSKIWQPFTYVVIIWHMYVRMYVGKCIAVCMHMRAHIYI